MLHLTCVPYRRGQGNKGKEVQHMRLKSAYEFLFIWYIQKEVFPQLFFAFAEQNFKL